MSRLPDGEPAPRDGSLPAAALDALGRRPFGVYVHVPFCAARCSYCDFNTYIPGVERDDRALFAQAALGELRLARRVLGDAAPPADTVFFGGGTPTLLAPGRLAALLDGVRGAVGLAPGAEVTLEANPESVDARFLRELRAAGFNRISLGMQSARPHVLRALDRRHTPGRAAAAAAQAREAGFEHVNLDLIYGAHGERDEDWEASVRAALNAGVDHLSAYGLIVEPGTRLHARVRAGRVAAPDDDMLTRRYRRADALLGAAGLGWAGTRIQLGGGRGGALAPQPRLLALGRLVGRRPGRALPRRRRALVERTPPARARRPARGRRVPGGRARAPRRARAAPRADHARVAPRRRARGRRRHRRPGGRAGRGRAPGADALAAGRAVLTLDGRVVGDAVARALTG